MTYYGPRELAAAFRTVRKNTIQIAKDIPEEKYAFRATADTRTIGETLAHIAVSTGYQHHIQSRGVTDIATVNFAELRQRFNAEAAKPRGKAELIALLESQGEEFASYLEGLSEGFLAETVAMRPGTTPATKSRFEMLLSPKEHEMHHRGQLMVLQRMIGLVPHLTREFEKRMAAASSPASR